MRARIAQKKTYGPMEWRCGFILDRGNRSHTDQQRGGAELPSSEVQTTSPLRKAERFSFGLEPKVVPVPKWPDKCQSLPYDETTPVEMALG